MIETLILGFLLGMITTGAGAAYAAYTFIKKPYIHKAFSSGYSVMAIDTNVDGDPSGYIGLKKDGKIVAGMKFSNEGITDIVYDI